jgi:Glycosyl hydrolases family 28
LSKRFLPLALLLLTSSLLAQSLPVCGDVRAFGANGDGVTLDTTAVSAAIAACVQQGGGTVYFTPGRYVIGTVQLASHIRLFLESGAALVGSHDIHDYLASPPFGFARHYGVDITGEGAVLGMLIAKNAEDISIEGQGEIDGQGDTFMSPQTSHGGNDYLKEYTRNPEKFEAAMTTIEYGPIEPNNRPGTMIVFFHCKNVRLHGITLRSAPNWTLHLQDVEGASISNIQILNNQNIPNNDGIDCMQCRYVRISDCNIIAGDDDFAIVASDHVNVSNCFVSSRSAAIRLESTKLSTFTGLSMDTNRGIAIFANGYPGQENRATEDVTFSDIVIRTRLIPGGWWGKAEPIYIAVQPCVPDISCGVRVRNVVFNNITAEAENGALLWGGKGTPITGVEFNGVRLHMIPPSPAMSESIGGNLDLRWTSTRQQDGIIKSDIPAFYARQVNGLQLRNVQVDWANSMPDYFSEGIRVEDFQDLTIDGFTGRQAQAATLTKPGTKHGAAIYLQNGTGVAITNSRATPGTHTFLQLDKVQNRRVFVNYDLSAAAQVIAPASQRFDTQIVPSTKPKPASQANSVPAK